MSVAVVCRSSSTVSFPLEKKEVLLDSIPMTTHPFAAAKEAAVIKNVDESPPPPPPAELIDIWTSIQARKAKQPNVDEPSYVHPLARRSSSLMSQKSLEVCTENLGSETGSDHYSSDEDVESMFSARRSVKQQVILQQQEELYQEQEDDVAGAKKKEQEAAVNYHCCSSSRRSAPSRAFPPPLPSISCRDGPCVQMRPHRKDGRLVVEAVAVPSQNYLHAHRHGGRLLLSFIDTTTPTPNNNIINTTNLTPPEQTQEPEEQEQEPEQLMDDADLMELEEDEEEEEEDEEEEVEVVDRGTVVEVKVSTQPQQHSSCGGGSALMKVHRSSIVINKFVSCTSLSKENYINSSDDVKHATSITNAGGPRRSTACGATTAAAAAVAASSLSAFPADGSQPSSFDNKLLFTSKRGNGREELLRDMRRCSQLRKPLFIWETCCIAT